MDRKNPDKRTNNKSDILSTHSQQSDELGYLYSIGEDEKKTLDEEMWEAILYVQRKKLPEKFEEAGILDHLALKPHFKACADGSMITFTEAIEQCLAAYKFLFSPSSDFVNERECIFVNEWVRAYKRANNFEDNDPRLGARQLLSSIVPLVENDAPIPPETLKMIPLQLMSATYRRAV
uniref:Uncharacterized protein n=1 Tax=Globodera pallida TaxID=36090 RepID=A0A183BK67_GLOPA